MSYQYDAEFFDFVNVSSGRSAAAFLAQFHARVLDAGAPVSVLDVGCGRGVWLAEWIKQGVGDVVGLDGPYVDSASLLIPGTLFQATDISRSFDLRRKFGLVECLEVAEHLREEAADTLVASLVRHADVVLFSAAVPGQGGEHHVNEQPLEYWRSKFAGCGYDVYDAIRPEVVALADIEPWYRYNALVYANNEGAKRLSVVARASLVPPGQALRNVAPYAWRARCAVIRALPAPMTFALARLKHRALNLAR
jgi:SAM-dependent methyltransferase